MAAAGHAEGAVLLAEGSTEKALVTLGGACRQWRELDAPYEAARVRVLLARTYTALGDTDAAALELDAAAVAFAELGAAGDAAAVDALRGTTRPPRPPG